jgi:hypothetical protein
MEDTTVRSETSHDPDRSHTKPSNTTANNILTVGKWTTGPPLRNRKVRNGRKFEIGRLLE